MDNKVYFSNRLDKLLNCIDEKTKIFIKKSNKIGIKVHFGEKNCDTFVSPLIVNEIYNFFKKINNDAEINLIECNVLYKGSRTITNDHINLAREHGFNFSNIDICDDKGDFEIKLNKKLKHFNFVKFGKNLKDYDFIFVVSHVKGHMMSGIGGSIKNVGMGLASRSGKFDLHSNIKPSINVLKCVGCGKCVLDCPVQAIKINKKSKIDSQKCIGCAHCIAFCKYNAISIPWNSVSNEELQERICEYCYGILQNKKMIYLNVLKNITKDCDCMGSKQKPEIEDIGFIFSGDIVAVDRASYEFINNYYGKNLFKKFHDDVNSEHQFNYGELIGLGKNKYNLINVK